MQIAVTYLTDFTPSSEGEYRSTLGWIWLWVFWTLFTVTSLGSIGSAVRALSTDQLTTRDIRAASVALVTFVLSLSGFTWVVIRAFYGQLYENAWGVFVGWLGILGVVFLVTLGWFCADDRSPAVVGWLAGVSVVLFTITAVGAIALIVQAANPKVHFTS